MYISEAETRKSIIDQTLYNAGWNPNNLSQVTQELDIWVEEYVTSNSKYEGHLFADYALLGRDGHPIAVVEAKRTLVDARIGKEQSRNYAEQIQKKTGKQMPFVFYTNGHDTYFWETEEYPPRKIYGFPTLEDLERIRFLRNNKQALSETFINKDISGRPYQIQAIRALMEEIEKKHRKFLLVMATGTGKTRTCISAIDALMRSNHVQRVLFLVDRIALQEQALEAFKDYLPNAPTWPKRGEKEITTDRRVYVCTYPTMLNIIENDKQPLSPHFFDLIVADESHRSIYNIYKNIFDYFDSIQLGLTATPKDSIDHNTFKLFNCENELPTFAYSYEEAVNNIPPYLCDFEVLKIRTKFQQQGINRGTIDSAEQKRLFAEGKDPDEIDYAGTELEKKVSNKGTNTLIVREFMEECIKDPSGVLPGKTIFFAVSKKHAFRLAEVFDSLYPEYKGKLTEVIISDIKGVHGKGGLLDKFKNQDMPRIAISVDMLDTGIDVREIVNLVFAKPVYSYTKFWQMIGRGTRVLDDHKTKEWCPKKDKFLIMDYWDNFDYFKMNPKGKEPAEQKPLPVRLFEARLNKLISAKGVTNVNVVAKTIIKLREDIEKLPKKSVIILDSASDIAKVESDEFWSVLTQEKMDYLKNTIAPLMRSLSGVDFKAMGFELDITELSTAKLMSEVKKFDALKEGVVEKVSELPLSVNIVAKEKDTIEKIKSAEFWYTFDDNELDETIEKLAPLMKYRETFNPKDSEEKLNLKDLLAIKEFVEFGPRNERMSTVKYREKVENLIEVLLENNIILKKLKSGKDLSQNEIKELANLLQEQDPYITEDLLQKIYDNKKAKFISLIKHVLGIENIGTFEEEVAKSFDEFIKEHNTFSNNQIRFLLTLKTYIIQTGKIEKRDLINAPFTQLHPEGIRGVFSNFEIDEILSFTTKLVA